MGSKPTHAFVPCEVPDYFDGLVWDAYGKRTCGIPRSAHPSSPPDPKPESEEQKAKRAAVCRYTPGPCTCGMHTTELGDWPRPDSAPKPRSKEWWIEKARREGDATIGAGVAAPEPVDVAKAIVEWLDQNVSKCQHGYITVSCGECMGRYLK